MSKRRRFVEVLGAQNAMNDEKSDSGEISDSSGSHQYLTAIQSHQSTTHV